MAITTNRGVYDAATNTWVPGPTETTYEGRVVRVYHEDYRAMSDVYTTATFATVVKDDGKIHEVLVNANFECDVSNGKAQVDADAWALEMWEKHQRKIEEQRRIAEEQRRAREAEAERNRPVKGKRMEVFKGRNVPVGTKGTVAYVSHSGRVLLKDDAVWQDRKADGVWVYAQNLRAV